MKKQLLFHWNWTALRALGAEYLPELRSITDVSEDFGSPIFLELVDE